MAAIEKSSQCVRKLRRRLYRGQGRSYGKIRGAGIADRRRVVRDAEGVVLVSVSVLEQWVFVRLLVAA